MKDSGNFVAEWYGHRVFPVVQRAPRALADQEAGRCPFLSTALQEDRACIKASSSKGVCSISSLSNGPRQDWLTCPYRALDDSLLEDAVQHLFGIRSKEPRFVVPAPALRHDDVRRRIEERFAASASVFIFFQDKLGGEISIPRTDRSPELSFDTTLVEVQRTGTATDVVRYGILEVQTMDFHGSYRHAVKNLSDALRLHRARFPDVLEANQRWIGERIEGPNISNVFKRTFYQLMLKFRIASREPCAGCVLALPKAVWDSWQRHLGAPELRARSDGSHELLVPGSSAPSGPALWIYVFDIATEGTATPAPIAIHQRIATSANAMAHFAFEVAPEAATAPAGPASLVPERLKQRLKQWWPEL